MTNRLPYWAAGAGLLLAAGSGFLASTALGVGAQAPPTKTVTVNIPEAGGCISGYTPGILVLNAPGGQVKVYTCLAK